jgi:hypothetical protein
MPQDPNLAGARTHGAHYLVARSFPVRRTPGKTKFIKLASRAVFLVAGGLAISFPPTTWVWWVIAVCAVLADTAHAGGSGRDCHSARCWTVVSCRCDRLAASDPAGSTRDDPAFTGNGAASRTNARLRHHRIRPRRPVQGDLHNAAGPPHDGHLRLSVSGVIAASREPLQPVILLSKETTRGPPRAGSQTPPLLDGARDRPAPPPCATPLFPTSLFTTQPAPAKGYHECPTFLPRPQNGANENYDEHESQYHDA